MPDFVQGRLLDPTLPKRYAAALRALQAFAAELKEPDGDPHRSYEELIRVARIALPASPGLISTADAKKAFAIGVLSLFHYEKTVRGGVAFDTVGYPGLSLFQTDLEPDAGEVSLRSALKRTLALSDGVWGEIDSFMDRELAALNLRRAVMRGLAPLLAPAPPAPERVHALFQALYPSSPLRAGEVEVIATATSVLFCVPYAGDRLTKPVGERNPEEEEQLRAFLAKLAQPYQHHFPVFGFFRGDDASPELLRELTQAVGATRDQVAQMLTSMVSILPLPQVAMYLVHDVWGHQWQAHLLPFEECFAPMGRYRRLPEIHRRVGGQTLLELVDAALAQAPGDDHWDAYVEAAFTERLVSSMSGPVSEMLADIVEYKFNTENPDHRLPSSSIFPDHPLKLDLTLIDATVFPRLALVGYRRLAESEAAAELLLERLRIERPDADEAALRAAVASLRARVARLEDWGPEITAKEQAAAVRVNAAARMSLNLVGAHIVLTDVYQRLESRGNWPPPLRGFRDLFVLSTAAFFQLDPAMNFWHLDEFVAGCFEDLLTAFCDALNSK